MSTTVTYKGSTLTTAENQTRILKTSGKVMEDDVTIVDITQSSSSSFTKIHTSTYTVSTEDTTATALSPTIDLGSTAYTSDKVLYVCVRDNAGKRNGYFYGTNSFLVNMYPKNSATTSITFQGMTYRVSSSGLYQTSTTLYGVYPYNITSAGVLTMRRRYNATFTLIINGTYTVDVYLVTPPSTLFA